MKKIFVLTMVFLVVLSFTAIAKKDECTTIQSGELYGSDGSLLTVGYNEWGYNYQARMFNGDWCDYHPLYRPGGASYDWCLENYNNTRLMMKWNDAWLSNKDCDGDTLLDRHYGHPSYIGSGAWLTNHESGEYEGVNGTTCKYNYFVKIVAVPTNASLINGTWYSADDVEIGPSIWGAFAIIQEVSNDKCAGDHGLLYKSPFKVGLGNW